MTGTCWSPSPTRSATCGTWRRAAGRSGGALRARAPGRCSRPSGGECNDTCRFINIFSCVKMRSIAFAQQKIAKKKPPSPRFAFLIFSIERKESISAHTGEKGGLYGGGNFHGKEGENCVKKVFRSPPAPEPRYTRNGSSLFFSFPFSFLQAGAKAFEKPKTCGKEGKGNLNFAPLFHS